MHFLIHVEPATRFDSVPAGLRFDLKELPVVEKLFENPKFLNFAKSVCPKDKQILD